MSMCACGLTTGRGAGACFSTTTTFSFRGDSTSTIGTARLVGCSATTTLCGTSPVLRPAAPCASFAWCTSVECRAFVLPISLCVWAFMSVDVIALTITVAMPTAVFMMLLISVRFFLLLSICNSNALPNCHLSRPTLVLSRPILTCPVSRPQKKVTSSLRPDDLMLPPSWRCGGFLICLELPVFFLGQVRIRLLDFFLKRRLVCRYFLAGSLVAYSQNLQCQYRRVLRCV